MGIRRAYGLKALGLCALLGIVSAGCDDGKKAQASISAVETEPLDKKPRAKEGEACSTNEDCDDRLGCAPDKTCQSYKTIECRSRDQTCKREGRCKGTDQGCIAGSDEDCKKSERCEESGYCSAEQGKCVAAKESDCSSVCTKQGRCTIENGECIPGSNDDCKQSEICKTQQKCVLRRGLCAKAPPKDDF